MKIDGSDDSKLRIDRPASSLDKLLGDLKPSRTSSRDIDATAEDIFDKISSRAKVHAWMDEYVVTEEFMIKIRRYARQEFDSMLLKVFIWLTGIAIGTIIAQLVIRR